MGRERVSLGKFSSTTSQLHRIRVEYFIRRPSSDENEKDGVVQPAPPARAPLRTIPISPHPPSYGLLTGNLPRLLLTVLSLYSPALRRSDGRSSFLFLASFPAFRLRSACLVACTSSGFPSRSPTDRPFPPFSPSPCPSPLHFKSGSKFVKTARAARGFGHLESLRLQNTSCRRISSRTFSAPSLTLSRQEDGN